MVNLCQSAFAGTTVCLAASSIVATRQVGLTGSVLLVCNEFGRIDRGTAHRRASQFTKRCAHPHEPKGAFAVATSFSGSRPAAGTAASSPTATGGGGGYSCTPWDVLLGVFQLFWPVQPQTLRKFGKRKYTPSDPRSMNRSPGLFTNPVVVGKPSTSWLGLRWFWPNEGEPATYHERP